MCHKTKPMKKDIYLKGILTIIAILLAIDLYYTVSSSSKYSKLEILSNENIEQLSDKSTENLSGQPVNIIGYNRRDYNGNLIPIPVYCVNCK